MNDADGTVGGPAGGPSVLVAFGHEAAQRLRTAVGKKAICGKYIDLVERSKRFENLPKGKPNDDGRHLCDKHKGLR